ncbi:hypothetical protein DFJ63DRAFT_65990 [Scheffersomyces coipomensis]|uniref:uncharacterized protein n=1 Tax=Scheffersomyces coipomensis TaxID=1788519 RepID=UPI00315CA9A0
MSNFEARKLYENIVEDVINESRQDFENSGIDESTLQELRRIWCEKLSQTQVAKFSWDDEDNMPSSSVAVADDGVPTGDSHAPSDLGGDGGEYALGEGSSGIEMSAIQNGVLTYPTVQHGLEAEVPSKNENTDVDNGTGLLLPNIGQSDGAFEFTVYTDDAKQFMKDLKAKNNGKKVKKIDQGDGNFGDDDDEDDDDIFNDSDDINSDLDDDLESDKSDGESGDQEGQLMLCLYDKVQRIKNKWKSNLKEGIANIDGKDYVFHKATGESEW